MTLRVTNSLTRRKEEFQPLDPAGKKVSWYACGPTVYGPIHIGNARTFVLQDVMRRWMSYIGYDVHFVQNITDVDDKIIARAQEEGASPEEVAEKYTALFLDHIARLGVKPADDHPRATVYIKEMIDFIAALVDKGNAYATEDGSVWFAVRSFGNYGKLSGRNVDDMVQGERVNADQQALKRDPLDFALWKGAKPGEPSWPSPWGNGRPGWHLECSCMSINCHHANTIDVHSGGVDLLFPHHENEVAQSEALTGEPFARYWLHLAFLNIDGDKMSKSLGNFKTLDKLLEKYDAITLRHFLISAHYRTELDFTEDNLALARKASKRYADAAREAEKALGKEPSPEAWKFDESAREMEAKFRDAMNDDFNTAKAFAVLFDTVTRLNTERAKGGNGLEAFASLLAMFRDLLGVTAELEGTHDDAVAGIEAQLLELLIETRAEARKAKQFAIGDMIRDRLAEMGIALKDSPQGTTWEKK